MIFKTFNGIRYLSNGAVSSMYSNVIPLGETAIDRNGEVVCDTALRFPTSNGDAIYPPNRTGVADAYLNNEDNFSFVSSYMTKNEVYRLYVSTDNKVVKIAITTLPSNTEADDKFLQMSTTTKVSYVRLNKTVSSNSADWSWCSSGIKPFQVYLACGNVILYFTESDYRIFSLVKPNFNPQSSQVSTALSQFDTIANVPDEVGIKKIVWYDNRLFALSLNGIVYFTCADPAQFFRPTSTRQNDWYSFEYGINYLWTGWQTSSLSNESVEDIAVCNGSLYFFNNSSYEVWTRTGMNDSPIACGVSSSISIPLKNPNVIDNVLFAINSTDNNLVAVSGADTQVVSNPIIARIIGSMSNPHIEPFSANGEKHCKVVDYKDGNAVAFSPATKYWYHLDESKKVETWIKYFVDLNIGISAKGDFVISNPLISYSSTTRNGLELIERCIIDYFNIYPKRVSVPKVTLISDFGSETNTYGLVPSTLGRQNMFNRPLNDDRNGILLSFSTNKGVGFCQQLRRPIPPLGRNAQNIVWSGLGSGFSLLLKFNYACRRRVIIYGIEVNER